jgi:hypothetical protein
MDRPANILGDQRAEGNLVRARVAAGCHRLPILDVKSQIGEIFARFGKLDGVLGHHLRQQARRIETGITGKTQFDLTVPSSRQTGADLDRIALGTAVVGFAVELSRAVMLDFQFAKVDLIG